MKSALMIVCVCLCVTIGESIKISYCGARMCGNTNAHSFCQYRMVPGRRCTGFINAELTGLEKSKILSRLNRRRNEAASGRLRGFPTAGNMLRLRWVEELAREAQLWANQCIPPRVPEENDKCRDLFSVTVGQCVASVIGDAPGLRVESMVDMWNMQSMLYKGNVTIYTPPAQNRSFYGDFGQIMWAKTYMVGCGRSRFMSESHDRLRKVERLVCNFAPRGPTAYRPLWSPTGPASDCPPRSKKHVVHHALCDYQYDINEYNDIDNTMTLEEHLLLNAVLEIERNESMDVHGFLDDIYIQSLSLANLKNIIITPSVNSIQKRDIVNVYNLHKEDLDANMIMDMATPEPNRTKVRKRKISTVGRPKSYRVEDLSETDEPKEENDDYIEKNIDTEIYGEYNFDGQDDHNHTGESITEDSKGTHYGYLLEKEGIYHSDVSTQSLAPDRQWLAPNTFETMYTVFDRSNETNYSPFVTEPNKIADTTSDFKVEDYLSDPETVRELQAALDRMELETSRMPELAGKVRRNIPNARTEPPAQTENENVEDKSSMMSKVFSYMPYLKQYEEDILGTNRSIRLCPSILAFIVFFVM